MNPLRQRMLNDMQAADSSRPKYEAPQPEHPLTTKVVLAVALGIFTAGLSWAQLFAIQTFPFN